MVSFHLPLDVEIMPSSNSIFISYRRSDSNDVTGRIYDRLQDHFGHDVVFKDVESIPFGDDFRTHLRRTVGQCQVVVAIIGPTWLGTLQQRLALTEQQDWVRAEIETALSREFAIPVIPLLVGGAMMPSDGDLPEGLRSLAYRNAAQARPDPDFHTDVDRLIQRLEDIVGKPELSANQPRESRSQQVPPQSERSSQAIAESSPYTSSSQSFGNVTFGGNDNAFNPIQAGGHATVSQNNSRQSMTISGSTISGQVGGIAGGDINQTLYQSQADSEDTPLSPQEIKQLIAEIKVLLQGSALPEGKKDKAINYLEAVGEETNEEEPDKDFATKNLQKVVKVLQEADEAMGVGQSLWSKVTPMLKKILPWLGVAAQALGL